MAVSGRSMAVSGGIRLRPGVEGDRERLYTLLRRALGPHVEAIYGPWDDAWQRRRFDETTDPTAHEIVEQGGEAVGCLLAESTPEALVLHRIFLLPEVQGRGLGSRLVRELQAGAQVIRLQVFRESPAVRFYERLGFRRLGETDTHVRMEWGAGK